VEFSPLTMVFGSEWVIDNEIRFGSLPFVADGSTWLQEAPLDAESLPIRGQHTSARAFSDSFSANRQSPSRRALVFPQDATTSAPAVHGSSGGHAMALQTMAEEVAALEPDEPVHVLFSSLHEGSEDEADCVSIESSAEILMASSEPVHANDSLRNDHKDEDPLLSPLTREQREELAERALHIHLLQR
jgi:hypothetical protein